MRNRRKPDVLNVAAHELDGLGVEQARQVTVRIGELFAIARETRDFSGEQFLQWFVEEQVEEEATMSDLLTVAERTREIPMLLEEYLARETPG